MELIHSHSKLIEIGNELLPCCRIQSLRMHPWMRHRATTNALAPAWCNRLGKEPHGGGGAGEDTAHVDEGRRGLRRGSSFRRCCALPVQCRRSTILLPSRCIGLPLPRCCALPRPCSSTLLLPSCRHRQQSRVAAPSRSSRLIVSRFKIRNGLGIGMDWGGGEGTGYMGENGAGRWIFAAISRAKSRRDSRAAGDLSPSSTPGTGRTTLLAG
ncbi:hypothetical protein SEVIR_3G244350v4 [Setaria viridis]